MQTVPNFGKVEEEMDLLRAQGQTSRVLFSAIGEHREVLDEKVTAMREAGVDITAVTVPRSGGGVGGLSTSNFWRTPRWNELRGMGFEERLAAVLDAGYRAQLVADVRDDEKLNEHVLKVTKRYYPMGGEARPKYTQSRYESLADVAAAAGEHPVETWLRLTLESKGKALFHQRGFNVDLENLEQLITTDWALPGLGDAGAHVSQMIDSGWATFVLSHWHRDKGAYSIQEAVRRIAGEPARVLGLKDRGVLAKGLKADVNVIDIDRLEERQPYIVNDFPGGAPRFQQRAQGYKATVCNGRVTLRDDEHTGARAGAVLRNRAA